MKLGNVYIKALEELKKYCTEHRCDHCELTKEVFDPYKGCPFGCPAQWRVDKFVPETLDYGSCDFDRHDLYDYFDNDEE